MSAKEMTPDVFRYKASDKLSAACLSTHTTYFPSEGAYGWSLWLGDSMAYCWTGRLYYDKGAAYNDGHKYRQHLIKLEEEQRNAQD
ncbi:hypothetical protein Axy09_004 [Achromobacter phage vB_AxyP_19-32_Axy09]|uniref:Uncharacterized protein n=1 Tax=Achromobacter phage vB_AxyP_19-32_Axy09 TaxID=2591040 RepID=A0A514CTV5_9CAUD|nr:hypothetical protein Axy09_004 [Achromobacter phage vB_AxyP_19-32_Axy09]